MSRRALSTEGTGSSGGAEVSTAPEPKTSPNAASGALLEVASKTGDAGAGAGVERFATANGSSSSREGEGRGGTARSDLMLTESSKTSPPPAGRLGPCGQFPE